VELLLSIKLRKKSSLICEFLIVIMQLYLLVISTMNFKILTIALVLALAAARTYPLYKQCDSRWAN